MKMHMRKERCWNPIINYALCGFYSMFSGCHRVYITNDKAKVTCKTCKKLMKY